MIQIDSSPHQSSPTSSQTPAGMWLVMQAIIENVQAVDTYENQGLFPLVAAITTMNEQFSNTWIGIMGQDQQKISTDAAGGSDPQVQSDMATFTAHNTCYNQMNSFLGGMIAAGNQNAGDISQLIQLVLQLYQQGPITQLQTIAQAM